MDRGETSQDASALLLLVSVTLQSGQSLHLYVWCGVVWCGEMTIISSLTIIVRLRPDIAQAVLGVK